MQTTQSPPLVRSRYNHFVRRSDGVMAYNARTGTFALLAAEVADWLQGQGPIPMSGDLDALTEMGFLHAGDELDQVFAAYAADQAGHALGLTIAPTLACNRSCEYCYQNEYRKDTMMSRETAEATAQFAVSMVEAGRKEVHVTWYGGEPLLAKDAVLFLSRRLDEEVRRAGGEIKGMGIITNGTLLDPDTSARLADVGVGSAQISVDSLVDDGRALRGIIDSEGRPSLLVRNAVSARSNLRVKVRVNVSARVRQHVPAILAFLREQGLEASTYLARVDDIDGEAGVITDEEGHRHRPSKKSLPVVRPDDYVLSRADFAHIEYETFLRKPQMLQHISDRLTPKTRTCGATFGSLFVVDPEGRISACWNSVGAPAETIGSVHGITVDAARALRSPFLDYTPLGYATCATCKVLPLCMGGCSHPRVHLDSPRSPCEAIKYQVEACVDLVGSRLAVGARQTEGARG